MRLTTRQHDALHRLTTALLDQDAAEVLVPPDQAKDGHWFGGGNLIPGDEGLWLVGRYRRAGDSRTGVAAGARGVRCAVFHWDPGGGAPEELASWSKSDLSGEADVLSIEGAALHRRRDGGWELFVSTEKAEAYPEAYAAYQKPGTGVWSIDRLRGPAPDRLEPEARQTVLRGRAPDALHVKDPVVVDRDERMQLLFSAHPVSWASSNTGLAVRLDDDADLEVDTHQLVARGAVWDVAATRITDVLAIPSVGAFEDTPELEVLFYDGAEAMRPLDQNPRGLKRPRGWSCEEIGGALWAPAGRPAEAHRLSLERAWFVSPHGTGSSRYVKTLRTPEGIHAIWQQAQDDGSQPLVHHLLPAERVEELLS